MTPESNALNLAQSAFEAVCKERDEALAKLSTVHRWVEKNLSGGFIDSLTHLQNLECVADDWYGRLVETIRERDEARDQLNAMREVIAAAEKCRHWHDCSYNEDTGKTEGVIISAESFWSLQNALAKLQPFLP